MPGLRALALATLTATAASAQPTVATLDPPSPFAYRLPTVTASGAAEPGAPPALRTAGVALVSGTGALVVGSSVVVIGALSRAATWGSPAASTETVFALGAMGSTVGAGLGVYFTALAAESWAGHRGFSGFLEVERRDGWTALLGAAAALPVALGTAYVLRGVGDGSLALVSVPVVQGLGAAVAVDLGR